MNMSLMGYSRRTLSTTASLWFGLAMCCLMNSASPLAYGQESGELRLAKIISDHGVLQQEKPIKIWGWAKAGTPVVVTMTQDPEQGAQVIGAAIASGQRREETAGESGDYAVTIRYVETNAPQLATQRREVTANADGLWMATFPPAKASFQPTWIAAQSGAVTVAVKNVLIGELWVCAGQSNMGWSNFNRKGREAASADFPGLRYVAWNDSWYKPREEIENNIRWQACTPEHAQRFSAVPYLFGTFLHRYLKVPVGVINVARGGTTGAKPGACRQSLLNSITSRSKRHCSNTTMKQLGGSSRRRSHG